MEQATKDGRTDGPRSFTIDHFLDRSPAGVSSMKTYRKLLSRCETLLGRPLAEASEHSISDMKVELRKMRSGPIYIRRLRAFYKSAGREDLAALCVLKQRVRRLAPDDILTLPEVNRLLEAADSLRDRGLIATLWATGQRVGAVCALRLKDLKDVPSDTGGAAIRVFFGTVKVAGEEHVSWILDGDGGDHLRAWLRAYPYDRGPDAPVFPSYNFSGERGSKALTASGALKVVQATARRGRIGKRVWPHLLRHSRATHLLRLGMGALDVKRLCGWSPASSVMEKTYSHLIDTDSYRALLRASGLPVPQTVDLGRIVSADEHMRPVVPMTTPPGATKRDLEPNPALTVPDLDRLLKNPEVLRFLRMVQEAAGAGPAPA